MNSCRFQHLLCSYLPREPIILKRTVFQAWLCSRVDPKVCIGGLLHNDWSIWSEICIFWRKSNKFYSYGHHRQQLAFECKHFVPAISMGNFYNIITSDAPRQAIKGIFSMLFRVFVLTSQFLFFCGVAAGTATQSMVMTISGNVIVLYLMLKTCDLQLNAE